MKRTFDWERATERIDKFDWKWNLEAQAAMKWNFSNNGMVNGRVKERVEL